MNPRAPVHALVGVCLALVTSGIGPTSAEPGVKVPGRPAPAVLDKLGAIEGALALAVAPAGLAAAVALPHPDEPRRSLLRIVRASDDAPREKTLPGIARALLFSDGELGLLVLLHRPSKKFDGETELVLLDAATFETLHEVRAPPSGMGLESWTERGLVVVAAQDELRTFLLPALRSGPLYRVPGRNLALAAIGGSSFLVGQDGALLALDLGDRQTATELPPRDRVTLPAAVAQLALGEDAQTGLARLVDGTLIEVQVDPLRATTTGSASAVVSVPPDAAARPRAGLSPVPPPPPPPPSTTPAGPSTVPPPASSPGAPAAPASTSPSSAPPPGASPAAPSTVPPGARSTTPPGFSTPTRPPGSPPPPGSSGAPGTPPPGSPTAPPPGSTAAPSAPAPVPAAATPEPGTATLRGRIAGDGREFIQAVIVLGPGNILREAQRVKPAADGSWEARGLAPGRYRVQLDGGPSRTLSTNPPFAAVELAAGATVETPEFRILGQW